MLHVHSYPLVRIRRPKTAIVGGLDRYGGLRRQLVKGLTNSLFRIHRIQPTPLPNPFFYCSPTAHHVSRPKELHRFRALESLSKKARKYIEENWWEYLCRRVKDESFDLFDKYLFDEERVLDIRMPAFRNIEQSLVSHFGVSVPRVRFIAEEGTQGCSNKGMMTCSRRLYTSTSSVSLAKIRS